MQGGNPLRCTTSRPTWLCQWVGRQVDQVDSIHRSHTLWCPACFGLCIYIYMIIYGWWLGTFLFFHMLGIIIPTDFHIFQRGWNHQPDINRSIGYLHPTKELWLLARWAHQQVFQQHIFDHLGWLKPYKQWNKPFINWCRISQPSTVCFVSLWKKTWKGAEIWCHDWTGWHLSTNDEKRILFQAAVSSSNSKKW